MPGIALALSSQESTGLNACQTPKPTIATASRPTNANRAIGPQLVPWMTFTGVIGGLPPPLPPAVLVGVPGFADVPVDLLPGLAPAAGLVDGRRLPPVCG